jgi:glucose dehydrogenase
MPDCSVDGLDAATGDPVVKVSHICAGIPGNSGLYAAGQVPPVFYKNTMIWSSSVSEGTDVGRGFVAAYDISTNQSSLLWRWYVTPGAGGDPKWDVNSCSTNSTSTCHGNVAPVSGDWGSMGYGNMTMAGAGPSFGDPVVDARLGIVYVSTSQPSPDWNGTYRPGPNLYSDSVVALNLTNSGKMLWFYQTTPHDLFDFDCGWNTALGNVTLPGGGTHEAVFKACKNGYVYALDALTGNKLWYFDPPSLVRLNTANADYVATGNYSGTLPWINSPSTAQFTQCPGTQGGVESDIAVAYGMVYVATHNYCTYGQVSDVQTVGSNVWGVKYLNPDNDANTTIYAIDASTGKAAWSYFIQGVPFRGWLTASGGMVFAGSLDGSIHILDAKTGRQVSSQYLGTSLYESPTIGSTASGQVYLFQLIGFTSFGPFSQPVPGALLAFAPTSSGPPAVWDVVQLAAVVALVASSIVLMAGARVKPLGSYA